LPESIRNKAHKVHREIGDALSGDQILIECRKHSDWSKIRGSESHHYFCAVASKNAYAVLQKRFTNVKK
jgi:hypothetical protein